VDCAPIVSVVSTVDKQRFVGQRRKKLHGSDAEAV
jgi:hypothetical protein